MPRYAAWLKGPDGSVVVVHSSKPIKACSVCQSKLSSFLCDAPVERPGLPATCDAPLCDDCRRPQGPDIDYCPNHEEAKRE